MTPTDDTFTNEPPDVGAKSSGAVISPIARIVWTVLILATLYLSYFHNLGAIGFVGPDEPRYAWIARDMAESGDWVTPRLYGKPWFEKPVLYYWGAAASFKLFGVSETAARLPSAICALLATLSMAWLAWKLYGAETARWLLVLLPTTVAMIGFSHAAATDMPFAGMLTVAMVFAAVIVGLTRDDDTPILPQTPWFALLFGCFLGLAVLAKGPAAMILSGSAVLLWAAFTHRWRDAFRCMHPTAIVAFCVTALPWYFLCARRNPEFFRVFIIEHNFKRFLTPEFQHVQPFWFYVPVVLIAFLPWTPSLLPFSFFGCLRLSRGQHSAPSTLFLLCWAIFCLVFFTISKSKLPGYILPAVPAIGLLMAKSFVQMSGRGSRIFRWLQNISGIVFIAVGATLFTFTSAGSKVNLKAADSAGWVLIAIGFASILFGLNRNRTLLSLAASSYCVVPVLLVWSFIGRIEPTFFLSYSSGKTLAADIVSKQIPLDHLFIENMGRGQQYSLNFYLHYETQSWDPSDPKEGYILLKSRSCRELVQPPLVCEEEPAGPGASGWFIYKVKKQK